MVHGGHGLETKQIPPLQGLVWRKEGQNPPPKKTQKRPLDRLERYPTKHPHRKELLEFAHTHTPCDYHQLFRITYKNSENTPHHQNDCQHAILSDREREGMPDRERARGCKHQKNSLGVNLHLITRKTVIRFSGLLPHNSGIDYQTK